MPETYCVRVIGSSFVRMADEAFIQGYAHGQLTFEKEHKSKQLSDIQIYELLIGAMISVAHSGRWNAGFITGWMQALFDKQPPRNEWLDTSITVEIEEISTT